MTTCTNAILATGIGMFTWYLAKTALVRFIQYDFVLPLFEDFIDNLQMVD